MNARYWIRIMYRAKDLKSIRNQSRGMIFQFSHCLNFNFDITRKFAQHMSKINSPPDSSKWPFDSPNGSHLAFERSLKTPQKGHLEEPGVVQPKPVVMPARASTSSGLPWACSPVQPHGGFRIHPEHSRPNQNPQPGDSKRDLFKGWWSVTRNQRLLNVTSNNLGDKKVTAWITWKLFHTIQGHNLGWLVGETLRFYYCWWSLPKN